ncbi:hypothetical protein CsatB_026408 [Cannabis sativa]
MDKSWISNKNRLSAKYNKGSQNFIRLSSSHLNEENKIRCPCVMCMNLYFHDLQTIERHIYVKGFYTRYVNWVHHGENILEESDHDNDDATDVEDFSDIGDNNNDVDHDVNDDMIPTIEDLAQEVPTHNVHKTIPNMLNAFENFEDSSDKEKWKNFHNLFDEVEKEFLSIKGFDMILELLKDAFPDDNKIPNSYYEVQKILSGLSLECETIDVCKDDCCLYWKDNKDATNCPICGHERYEYTAADMRWHKEKCVDTEGVLKHPADAEAWNFDKQYPDFAKEPRNIRLGFATDGFNPFGDLSNSYNMWPVILMPYNMPPWICMKRESLMMAVLIPGRRAPGKDIDTINDFPAYGTVSGYSTQGYKACPVCEDDTSSFRVRGKISYMGHRQYLCVEHQWRNDKEYDGTIETRNPPQELTSDEILTKLDGMWKCRSGKNVDIVKDDQNQMKNAGYENKANWRRKSILWELAYRPKLKLRHNLDVMHIEKNICDSVVGTMFSIDGKCKDTDKARLDLQDLKIRKQLQMKKRGNKWVKPTACYTLSMKERQTICKFLESVKFPNGYAENLSRNIIMKDGKITAVHLPKEAKLGGPVQMRWMYSIEREMGHLKKYVKNKARLEGSIAEGYIISEALNFFSMYLHGIETRFNCPDRNPDDVGVRRQSTLSIFNLPTRPFRKQSSIRISEDERNMVHWYILNNCPELEPNLE